MDIDAVMLARIQFAANITFHILFPTITIALGWILLFFKLRFQKTGDYKWMNSYFFFTKVFALCFAIGVVTGITMSFQFGTNWPGFMLTVGNIAGPLLAYEVLTAFFLEATFLGIMFFGFKRVKPWVHTLATVLVAAGTTLSAFWILALNSWMQTPVGFEMVNGKAVPTDWLQILFSPSMPYRFTHMLLASALTASFLIAGLSAYRWLRNDRTATVLATLKTGVYLAAFLIPVQIFVGDLHGLNTRIHQPAKIAAIEGLWETRTEAPLVLFALPDEAGKTNNWVWEVPKLASFILAHDWHGEIKGLNEFEGEHPPVAPVFWSFRVMVGIGLLMLIVSWTSAFFLCKRQSLPPFMARVLVGMTFAGSVATIAGWWVTEIGRQPYLVQGVLKVADAASDVSKPMLTTSLTGYMGVYVFLLLAFMTTVFYMARHAHENQIDGPEGNGTLGAWGAPIAKDQAKDEEAR